MDSFSDANIAPMHDILQDALDDLVSSRTSLADKGDALMAIEHVLAETCDPRAEGLLTYFNALQDTFQCNVSSRLIAWTAASSLQLEGLLNKGSADREKKSEAVLLDLLLVSRHLNSGSTPSSSTPTSPKAGTPSAQAPKTTEIPLASVIIDTLLCILVDSIPALRVFEDLSGVQVVVKILKRAGTPREVRMKCLEFLYFYLLDETTSVSDNFSESTVSTPESTPSPNVAHPHRSYPSISVSSDASYTTAISSRSSSASSAFSTSSTSTAATSRSLHELAASRNAEPTKTDNPQHPLQPLLPKQVIPGLVPSQRTVTPPSHVNAINALGRGQPRSLVMLKREVDYVPLSPKKPEISHLGHRPSGLRPKLRERTNVSTKLRMPMDVLSSEETEGEDAASRNVAVSTPRARPSAHSRGYSVSSTSSMSSTSSLASADDSHTSTPRRGGEDSKGKGRDVQTPKMPSKLHRRTQSLADVVTESPMRMSGLEATPNLKMGPRSASTPTGSAKKGPRTMEEKKEILGSMLGNVDALVDGVRKAGIWGLS
ncbi:hypothetical protein ONZ51_g4973 [Trametes cubensis]|uniref:Cell division control protein 14 n=1 Tax=Trametes cubensis TaxID=1111947 RepID=A0AAD7XE38_9APHY|nr:hypothetical protein ONZ51_g4973 [Trametes cubensis]